MRISKSNLIKIIAASGGFGALATLLYLVPGFQFPIFPGVSFLKIHFDEIICLFGSLAYGPLVGFITIIIKGVFKLITDLGETGGVGVLCDLFYGFALVLPAAIYYKYHKNFKGALIGLGIGFVVYLISTCLIGYYLFYPLYGFFFNPSASSYEEAMNTVASLFIAADGSITGWQDFKIIYQFILPFNLIKGGVVVTMTILIYKPLRVLIEKIKLKKAK